MRKLVSRKQQDTAKRVNAYRQHRNCLKTLQQRDRINEYHKSKKDRKWPQKTFSVV